MLAAAVVPVMVRPKAELVHRAQQDASARLFELRPAHPRRPPARTARAVKAPISRRSLVQGYTAWGAALALGCEAKGDDARERASFWFSYGGKNREVLERLVARFHDESSQTRIDATFQGDYYEALAKLRTALSARVAPAMSHVVAEVVPYLAEAGVLERLDGYDGAASLDLVPSLAQARTWAGGDQKPLVAVPFNRSTPIMYLNQRLLERAGVQASSHVGASCEARPTRSPSGEGRTSRCGALLVRCLGGSGWRWWRRRGIVVDADGKVTLGGEAGERALSLWQIAGAP